VSAPTDPVAVLAIMAQENDESARSFENMALRQDFKGRFGEANARKARADALFYRQRAEACRAGMAAIAMAKAQPQAQLVTA
jgi:hypothetical protein